MRKTKFLISAILFLSMVTAIIAQEHIVSDSTKNPYRSAIFINIGFFGLWLAGNINIEQKIIHNGSFTFCLRAGVGRIVSWADPITELIGSANILLGRNGHYFESNLGACTLKDRGADVSIWPYAYLGYRRQKPGKKLILRLGAGFPDSICVGAGVCF